MLFLSATAGYAKIKAQHDKTKDFTQYKTYSWFPPRVLKNVGIVEDDEVIAPRIRESVNRQMQRLGLKEVPANGDLQISAVALAESVPSMDATIYAGSNIPLPTGTDPTGMLIPMVEMGGYNKQGTLVLNLIDGGTKKTAWVAMAQEGIKRGQKPGSGIDKAVVNMFKKYPIKP